VTTSHQNPNPRSSPATARNSALTKRARDPAVPPSQPAARDTSDLTGPDTSDLTGPDTSDLTGPDTSDLTGRDTSDLTGRAEARTPSRTRPATRDSPPASQRNGFSHPGRVPGRSLFGARSSPSPAKDLPERTRLLVFDPAGSLTPSGRPAGHASHDTATAPIMPM
jgi:hypothetical protein